MYIYTHIYIREVVMLKLGRLVTLDGVDIDTEEKVCIRIYCILIYKYIGNICSFCMCIVCVCIAA